MFTFSPIEHTRNVKNANIVKTVFEWEIENIRLVKTKVGEVLSSPVFNVNGEKWQLNLCPNGRIQKLEGYVCVVVQLLSQEKSSELTIVISFTNYYKKLLLSCTECIPCTAGHSTWNFEKILEYEKLLEMLNHVLPDNKLKVKCEFLPKTSDSLSVDTSLTFESYFNSEKHSDVKFSVNGRILYAHKVILSNKSDVFSAMFEHCMKENLENIVNVEDVDFEVLAELLRFVYSGRVNNIQNIVNDLLMAADKYAIDDLKFICGEYLCHNLSNHNVIVYLDLADLYGVKTLRTKAMEFILANAKTLIDIPSFKSIVNLRGDLVFEIFQYLVLNLSKNSESTDDSILNLSSRYTPSYCSHLVPKS